jgi:small subunit ribosomal protein S8
MLTRIRNAVRNHASHVLIPRSKFKLNIARVLKEEGYVSDIDEIDDGKQGTIRVALKYGPRGEQVLNHISRESKAGCRKFVNVDELPDVLNGLGISILSTSKGVMSDRRCREERVGGELLCTVY